MLPSQPNVSDQALSDHAPTYHRLPPFHIWPLLKTTLLCARVPSMNTRQPRGENFRDPLLPPLKYSWVLLSGHRPSEGHRNKFFEGKHWTHPQRAHQVLSHSFICSFTHYLPNKRIIYWILTEAEELGRLLKGMKRKKSILQFQRPRMAEEYDLDTQLQFPHQ